MSLVILFAIPGLAALVFWIAQPSANASRRAALRERVVAHLREHAEIDTQTYKALIGTSRRTAMPLMELLDDRLKADDGARDELREHRDIGRESKWVSLDWRMASTYVDQIRNGLEGEE